MTDDIKYDLLKRIPLVPIHGSVLLPKAVIPITIPMSQYFNYARQIPGEFQYLGIVQPIRNKYQAKKALSPYYQFGTMGRILDSEYADDGEVVLLVEGIIRFKIIKTLFDNNGLLYANVDYETYQHDILEKDESISLANRPYLLEVLDTYLKLNGINPNWSDIDSTSDARLISTIALLCPFKAAEKQALLEMSDLKKQSELITQLMEFENHSTTNKKSTWH